MQTIISKIDSNDIDKNELKKHSELLKNGETVIFPTETVYGLGANALDENAVKKIYEAKGRPSDNPLIVHIHNKDLIYDLAKDIDDKAKKVIDKFWPGPLTVILKKNDKVPKTTTGGLDTVAIRMPKNDIALELLRECNLPIAAPSANISGKPSPTNGKHVVDSMNGRVAGIIIGDDCDYGLESTVVDFTEEIPMILRPGSITKKDLENVIGKVEIDPSLLNHEDNKKAKAPGMKYKHYSPDAEVFIVSGKNDDVIEKINSLIDENDKNGLKSGVLCLEKNKKKYKGKVISLGENFKEVGRNLFNSLITMDNEKINVVYSEEFLDDEVGMAIMNRLLKSSGYKVIRV